MSDVEVWKASQAATTKNLTSKLACGIFVAAVEIHGLAPGSSMKRTNFSSLFNKISAACPLVFHSAVSRILCVDHAAM
jgi:hypothetical protein